jgi:integrase
LVAGIRRVKGVPQLGRHVGNWLSATEGKQLLSEFNAQTLRDKRDLAIVSLLLGCGLRRSEVVALKVDNIQRPEDHWAIVDLVGKAGHVRTVPVPSWVKAAVDAWAQDAPVANGKLFRSIRKDETVWGDGITQNVIWYVVKHCAKRAGINALAPHDLRRTCARLCHGAGGELEQIQFLLGHASVQTTERYIGCTQDLSRAVNDRLPFASLPAGTSESR